MAVGLKGLARLFGRGKGECEHLRELASLYLESEASNGMSDDVRARVREHLEGCTDCSAFYATLRETIQMLQSLPLQEIPQKLLNALLQIEKEQGSASSQG